MGVEKLALNLVKAMGVGAKKASPSTMAKLTKGLQRMPADEFARHIETGADFLKATPITGTMVKEIKSNLQMFGLKATPREVIRAVKHLVHESTAISKTIRNKGHRSLTGLQKQLFEMCAASCQGLAKVLK